MFGDFCIGHFKIYLQNSTENIKGTSEFLKKMLHM